MAKPTTQEVTEITKLYDGLYINFRTKTDPQEPLLLAHYTSVQVVEQILKHEELWFSNPLYMNDLEEMRLGIAIGADIFPQFAQQAAESPDRVSRLVQEFNHFITHLATIAAIDTYVFCLSEHPLGNFDGLLPMWREYGSKGNGAALVFNMQKIHYQPQHPVIIVKVMYATFEQRVAELNARLFDWVRITRDAELADDRLDLAAYAAFCFVKSFALTTKHPGFLEEQEWRATYLPERDPQGYFKDCLDYFVGPRGVEPKLKFKFAMPPTPNSPPPLTPGKLSDILEFIILGPTVSSPLSRSAFIRMLERTGKGEFSNRVASSSIPLRPQL
jgi:hypothetical protein